MKIRASNWKLESIMAALIGYSGKKVDTTVKKFGVNTFFFKKKIQFNIFVSTLIIIRNIFEHQIDIL